MNELTKCQARVADYTGLHYFVCAKPVKHTYHDPASPGRYVPVCGIHKRVFLRWVEENRAWDMVKFWWRK